MAATMAENNQDKHNKYYVKQKHFQILKYYITVKKHKAVLEPRVSPAFAITYFCNHCNI